MKARLKKRKFIKKLENGEIPTAEFNMFTEESAIGGFSINKKQVIIFLAVFAIASMSAWLRVTGIVDIFKVSYESATVVVVSFILAEFAIANVFVSDTTSPKNKIVELFALGIIQVVLFSLSFVIEFSALSNKIMVTKNSNEFVINQERALNEQKQALNDQLVLVKGEYANLPENRLSLRQKTLKHLDEINAQKAEVQSKIDKLYSSKENKEQKINGVTLEHTATLLGVSEKDLTKYIVITIAGILNILYVLLMYSGIKEGKEYDEYEEEE